MELQTPSINPPAPLFEPDDMIAVEPPCHPEEPIKEASNGTKSCTAWCAEGFVLPT